MSHCRDSSLPDELNTVVEKRIDATHLLLTNDPLFMFEVLLTCRSRGKSISAQTLQTFTSPVHIELLMTASCHIIDVLEQSRVCWHLVRELIDEMAYFITSCPIAATATCRTTSLTSRRSAQRQHICSYGYLSPEYVCTKCEVLPVPRAGSFSWHKHLKPSIP